MAAEIKSICNFCKKPIQNKSEETSLAFPGSKIEAIQQQATYHLACSQTIYSQVLSGSLSNRVTTLQTSPAEKKAEDDEGIPSGHSSESDPLGRALTEIHRALESDGPDS